MSDRFCVLFDGTSIAEPTSVEMAIACLVAGFFVFNIEHPKTCHHFLNFVSSYLFGVKYDKGTTIKSRSLLVKLNEEKVKLSSKST